MLIREAGEADLEAVINLLAELDQEADFGKERAHQVFKRIGRYPYYKIFVAEKGPAIVGTFTLIICDNLGHGGKPFAVVDNVVVDPQWRGNGIGTRMMYHAYTVSREEGCYKMMLSSDQKRVRAHEFYLKLGLPQQGLSFATGLQ